MQTPPPLPPPLPTQKRGMPLWPFLVVGVFLVVGLLMAAGYYAVTGFFGRFDAEAEALMEQLNAEEGIPMTAAQWAAMYPPVDESRNAAPFYTQALEAMVYPEDDEAWDTLVANYPDFRYVQETVDLPRVTAFLEENADTLRLMREALNMPACRFDIDFTSGILAGRDYFVDLSDLCWLLAFEAVHAVETGNPDRAKHAIMQSLAIIRDMAEVPVMHAQDYASWSLQNVADAFSFTCSRRTFDGEALAGISEVLAETVPMTRTRRAYIADAAAVNVTLGKLRRGEISMADLANAVEHELGFDEELALENPLIVQPLCANTHRIYLEEIQAFLTMAGLPMTERPSALQRIEERVSELERGFNFAHSMLASVCARAHEFHLEDVTHHLVQAAIAVERYRLANEALPETLEALETYTADPAHLRDPMTGDYLRYTREEGGYLLYSVAANGTDDGAPELEGYWDTQWYEGDWMFRVVYGPTAEADGTAPR